VSAPFANSRYTADPMLAAVILRDGTEVPTKDITAAISMWAIKKVRWTDGSTSWAKGWSRWDEEYTEKWLLVRIGAGANGAKTVWLNEPTALDRR